MGTISISTKRTPYTNQDVTNTINSHTRHIAKTSRSTVHTTAVTDRYATATYGSTISSNRSLTMTTTRRLATLQIITMFTSGRETYRHVDQHSQHTVNLVIFQQHDHIKHSQKYQDTHVLQPHRDVTVRPISIRYTKSTTGETATKVLPYNHREPETRKVKRDSQVARPIAHMANEVTDRPRTDVHNRSDQPIANQGRAHTRMSRQISAPHNFRTIGPPRHPPYLLTPVSTEDKQLPIGRQGHAPSRTTHTNLKRRFVNLNLQHTNLQTNRVVDALASTDQTYHIGLTVNVEISMSNTLIRLSRHRVSTHHLNLHTIPTTLMTYNIRTNIYQHSEYSSRTSNSRNNNR